MGFRKMRVELVLGWKELIANRAIDGLVQLIPEI